MPVTSTLRPGPADAIVSVNSFGAGPGLNFDFETLSFHVPFAGSLSCASATLHDTTANRIARSPGTDRRRHTLIATSSAPPNVFGKRFVWENEGSLHLRAIGRQRD